MKNQKCHKVFYEQPFCTLCFESFYFNDKYIFNIQWLMAVIMEMKKRRSWHGEGSKVKPSADKERIFIHQNENRESPLVGTDTYSFFKRLVALDGLYFL